ncbi:sugar ABC transporter ATP-binding protein [Streptomyces sp. NPDC048481]|uniref:sugar ABC transporter ATP-binding protein n=1 Tax=Streptomyces sp. NPDC048481 TaxID=3365557 RepID=UPI00371D1E33
MPAPPLPAAPGAAPAERGAIGRQGRPVRVRRPHHAREPGIAAVHRDPAPYGDLDTLGSPWGRGIRRSGFLEGVETERRRTGGRPPERPTGGPRGPAGPRGPVVPLRGGRRRTVAVARPLPDDLRVLLLDEPTAALGSERTPEVLDLVDRSRGRGPGVPFIGHGPGDVDTASREQIVSSITGATQNVPRRPAGREAGW